jgi:hypothetical protein
MSKFLPAAVSVLGLAVLVLGILAFNPTWLPIASLQEDTNGISMTDESVRRLGLNEQLETLHRRRETKLQIAGEVIARECSLAEAVDQYRDLNRQWPPTPCPDRLLLQGLGMSSEEEWNAQEVLYFARVALADHSYEMAVEVSRLEKELQQLLVERKKQSTVPTDARTD